MANSGSIEAVYAGRFIAGIGVGETVVVGPVYLSEISPAPIRGLCTCAFTGAVYLGIMLAYFSVYGSEIHIPESYNRWVRFCPSPRTLANKQAVPTSVHIMFAGILLILSFFQMESPRHLVRTEQREKALETLCRFRGLPSDHPYVQREMAEMEISYHAEKEATLGAGWAGILKEMFLIPNNSYRLLLTNLAQFMACWSGGSAMTVYAPDLFAIVGVTGQEQALLSTAIFGVVKFISSIICALFLVDYAGRKRALIYGITLQLLAMIYIAAFLLVVPVANNPSFTPTPSQSRASTAAIAAIYISGAGWALGWNSGQYLLSSELFPLRIRAICSSITMSIHFANQYAVNRALPNMLLEQGHGLTPSGTFWFFSVITVLGGVWVWLCVPEAAGRSLESIDRLFELRWYRIGLFGRKVAEEFDRVQEELGAEKERNVDGKDDGVRGGC